MPPLKQPPSLSEICIRHAARLVVSGILAIQRRHTHIDNPACQSAAVALRDHFLHQVGQQFDAVCRLIACHTTDFPGDCRVFAYVMLHEHTRTASHLWRRGGGDDAFWCRVLGALRHVTTLELARVHCTDATFRVIGATCAQHLRVIAFSSGSADFTRDALRSLTRCTHLEVVQDTQELRKFARRATELVGLLHFLPRLISVNHLAMGDLLARYAMFSVVTRPLQLRAAAQLQCRGRQMRAIVAACPHLEQLLLSRGTTTSGENDALDVLARSGLAASHLELVCFPLTELTPMLNVKGRHLTTLAIEHVALWCSSGYMEVVMIGRTCPHLEEFMYAVYRPAAQPTTTEFRRDDSVDSTAGHKSFEHLQLLTVKGCLELVDRVLPICLQHAEHIDRIKLKIYDEHDDPVTPLPQHFLATGNPMAELQYLTFYGAAILMATPDIVDVWYTQLTGLRVLRVAALMTEEVVAYMRRREAEIVINNLDFRLKWTNLDFLEEDGDDGHHHQPQQQQQQEPPPGEVVNGGHVADEGEEAGWLQWAWMWLRSTLCGVVRVATAAVIRR